MRNHQIQIENLYYVTENEKDLYFNFRVEEKTLILKISCKHFSNIWKNDKICNLKIKIKKIQSFQCTCFFKAYRFKNKNKRKDNALPPIPIPVIYLYFDCSVRGKNIQTE